MAKPVCANCGITVEWQPTVLDGRTYCCLGCAVGGPCTCDYSNLPRVGELRAIVRHTTVILLSGGCARPAASTQEEAAAQPTEDVP